MHIWYIGSWYDLLPLLHTIPLVTDTTTMRIDTTYRSWEELPIDLVQERIAGACASLHKKWVTHILLPTWCEAILTAPGADRQLVHGLICIPLFTTYLTQYVLPASRVGKLGVLTAAPDIYTKQRQESIQTHADQVKPTARQSAHRALQTPWARRSVSGHLPAQMVPYMGGKNRMIRNIWKNTLRPLRDAWVDTVMLASWEFLTYDTILRHYAAGKKVTFHGKKAVQKAWDTVIPWWAWSYSHQPYQQQHIEVITTSNAPRIYTPKRTYILSWWGKRTMTQTQELSL